jgi:hypothetical protein
MQIKSTITGFAIAIAWPETLCKGPGSWYDPLLNFAGISRHYYYKAGHAALVLVDAQKLKCHYFDFGRYHAPFNKGRVRSALTDHGLAVKTIPRISEDGKIANFKEILTELQHNAECHGEGAIYASYKPVDFEKAFAKANSLQAHSPIHYGPFQFRGSNCSRFVNNAIAAGKPGLFSYLKLKIFVPLTPTPLNNVNALNHKTVLPKMLKIPAFEPKPLRDKNFLKTTLPAPEPKASIPENALWLSGEGAGSWFQIEENGKGIHITRYSPEGAPECSGLFMSANGAAINLSEDFEIIHLSHCHAVRIKQHGQVVELKRIGGVN